MSDLIGLTIGQGRYRLENKLGAGGQGAVYRGRHLALDIPVAIKILTSAGGPAFQAQDAVAQKRFEREAKRSAHLRHPNIVVVHDYGREDGFYYIVADYVEGLNLQARLTQARGVLPRAEALAYTQQIGSALQYAHEQGTIHRDIKPSNILLCAGAEPHPTYKALLCDFGLARLVADESLDATTDKDWLPGTPAYMSPEQCLAMPLDARTDIYSFGLVVYEMFAGQHPLLSSNDTPGTIRYKQVHEMPPAPRTLNSALPAGVDAVLLKALAKNPAKRYATIAAFVADLEHALGQPAAGPQPPPTPRPAPPHKSPARQARPPRKRRHAGCWLSLIALVVVWIGISRGWFSLSGLLPTSTSVRTRTATPTRPPATDAAQVVSATSTPVKSASEPVCSQAGICLSSPSMNQSVSGNLSIEGTAVINGFQFFKIEIASGEEPTAWSVVHETHSNTVERGKLEELDTTSLPNGVYWLRLVVVDQTGNFPAPAAVRFEVHN